uniref:Kinesin motor domain-containing protein n=1 Tax=Pyrodinium bahamense TaxID=73915 RepID=A0A7S0FWA5_9DINO|mmetsp:Transcript_5226/g.14438  ORF Transcript_5226/g.14438 Transcript_5226/m.14438 type:complete len:517 (+) Transcript_5226:153-1703(+)
MTTAAKPEQESSKELENAATKIQAVFRGKQAREENNGSAAITVGLRMRPFVPHEKKHGEPKPCIEIADNIVKVVPAAGLDDKDSKEGPWKFDLAMDSSVSTSPVFVNNEKCYQLMGRRMIEDILQGFNTCLFCYGQTGTGKTTTIMGDPTNGPGLLRRLLDDIFAEAGTMRQGGCQVDITVQMLEVYNEELNDLLLEKGKEKKKIETHKLPSGVEVKGATTKVVQSADECQQLIDYGNSNKTIAATNMNPQSSRGHTVFKLEFRKTGGPDGTRLKSEVYFADLAGHENIKTTAVTGDRLKELTFINGSLMWLQNALHSMAEASAKGGNQKVDFSKFRNSKLTLLLSNALTGNSKTAVIVTLSPSIDHFETSLSSIKFAIEVKGIKVKATSTAGKDPKAVIAKLEQENKELKEKLAAAQAGSEGPETQALKDEITSLKEQLAAAGGSGGPGDQALRDEEHLGATQPSSARPDTKAFQAKVAELQFKLVAGKAFGPDTKALKGELVELKQQLPPSPAV